MTQKKDPNLNAKNLCLPELFWQFGGEKLAVHRRTFRTIRRCGWKELFRSFNLSTRASKTEFVCKSYDPAKFAVKTVPGQKKLRFCAAAELHGHAFGRCFEVDSESGKTRVGAAGKGHFLCRGRPTTRTLRKRPKTSQNERKTGRFRPEVGHGCRGREN